MEKQWKLKFFTIWSGQAVSVLSSAVLQMALIWHLTAATQSALILSLASIAGFLPMALLGSIAGTVVDRLPRKAVMIGADLFIAAVSLVLVFFALAGDLPVWLIMTVLAVRSVGTAFHTPAINAATPLIVPQDMLTKCAGYTQSLQTVGYIAGTAVAGILFPVWSISAMVLLDAAGAVIASLAVAFVKIPEPSKGNKPGRGGFLAELRAGYQVIRRQKGLFALLWVGAAFMFIYSPINALFPLMGMGYFGGTTVHASIAEITFSVGMILGGVVLGAWGGFQNRAASITFAIALMGAAIGISGLLPPEGFVVFAVLCIFMGATVPFYSGPQVALMQEKVVPEYLGRVFGLYDSIMGLAMPFGLAASGLFADRIGVHTWFFLCGVGCLLLAAVTFSIPSIRNIEKQ